MTEPVTTALLSYGGPGIAIVILIAAVCYLYKQNQSIQEKRISEGLQAQANNLKNIETITRLEGLVKDVLALATENGRKRRP